MKADEIAHKNFPRGVSDEMWAGAVKVSHAALKEGRRELAKELLKEFGDNETFISLIEVLKKELG